MNNYDIWKALSEEIYQYDYQNPYDGEVVNDLEATYERRKLNNIDLASLNFDNKSLKHLIRCRLLPDKEILSIILSNFVKCDVIYLMIIYLSERDEILIDPLYQIISKFDIADVIIPKNNEIVYLLDQRRLD